MPERQMMSLRVNISFAAFVSSWLSGEVSIECFYCYFCAQFCFLPRISHKLREREMLDEMTLTWLVC